MSLNSFYVILKGGEPMYLQHLDYFLLKWDTYSEFTGPENISVTSVSLLVLVVTAQTTRDECCVLMRFPLSTIRTWALSPENRSICGALDGWPSYKSFWHRSNSPRFWSLVAFAMMSTNPDRLAGDVAANSCVLIDQYLVRRRVPRRQLQPGSVAAMLIASDFEGICPSEVHVFVYNTADAYTRDELIKWRIGYLPPWNSASRRPRLPISWSLLDKWADAMHDSGTSLSPWVDTCHHILCDRQWSFPTVSSVVRVPSSRQVLSLSQKCYGNGFLGQTETPRREAWSVSSFPGGVVPLHNVALTFSQDSRRVWTSWLPVGWLVFVGKHPTRDSWGTSEHRDGLCAVVPVSHEYLGATASDLGSVGECANCRALCEYWCQDGKCATRTKARVAWKVLLYCSNRASFCSHALILLSPTRWIVMTGWRTSISLQPFVQTRGSLLYTSISLHPVFQTCLDCGYLFAYTHQSPALCLKHVWIVVSCLSTSIRQQPFVSNTFDHGCLFVYKHQSWDKMATAWVRRRPHSERSGVSSFSRFTLPPTPKWRWHLNWRRFKIEPEVVNLLGESNYLKWMIWHCWAVKRNILAGKPHRVPVWWRVCG